MLVDARRRAAWRGRRGRTASATTAAAVSPMASSKTCSSTARARAAPGSSGRNGVDAHRLAWPSPTTRRRAPRSSVEPSLGRGPGRVVGVVVGPVGEEAGHGRSQAPRRGRRASVRSPTGHNGTAEGPRPWWFPSADRRPLAVGRHRGPWCRWARLRHVDNETIIALSFQVGVRRRRVPSIAPPPPGTPRIGPRRRSPQVPAPVRHLGADDRSSQRIRIVDATLSCLASQGLAKTTLDDIAGWAGLSRATVYRAFPGGPGGDLGRGGRHRGRPAVLASWPWRWGRPRDLEEVLVVGIVETARRLRGAPLPSAISLEHEPGVVLPHMCFEQMNRVLERRVVVRGPVPRPLARARPGRPGRRVGRPDHLQLPVDARRAVARPDRPRGRRAPGEPVRAPRRARAARRRRARSTARRSRQPATAPSRTRRCTDEREGQRTSWRSTRWAERSTSAMRSTEEIIGRADVNDLEAILSFIGHEERERPPPRRRPLRGRVHLGLREGPAREAGQALREGEDRPVERPRPTCPGTRRSTRRRR